MVTRTLYVDAPGARLAVDIDGPDPVDILLCHGGPGGPDDFAEVRALLASWGVSCARFDQRGVGRSSVEDERWDLSAYATDVDAIRESLGVERLIVLGHSWGGVVARAWAQAFPDRVRGVLLASPSAAVGDDWPAMEAEVMAYLQRRVSALEWASVGLYSLATSLPGAMGDRAMAEVYRRVVRAYTGVAEAPEWIHRSSARAAHRTRAAVRKQPADCLDDLGLPRGVPVRAQFGDDDIYGPFVEQFIARHPEIEVTVFDACGHVAWHDTPEHWSTWLRDGLIACGFQCLVPGRPEDSG